MVLIFDIETNVPGAKPDPEQDIFRFMGAYDYEADEYHFLEDEQEIKDLFKKHRVIVGYNSKGYDEPILKRHGLMPYRHIHIDLMEVIKKRQSVLGCTNESKSLRNMAKFFGLTQDKDNLDYNLLKKETLSTSEYNEIKRYTLQDIKVTKELFDKLSKEFETFKEFMSKHDNMTYKWLTSSISVYTYKVICNLVGIKEEYDDNVEHQRFTGGFVALPSQKEAHGDIYCLDFNSLYPHNMIQGNLFSHSCRCCADEDKWNGNELFPIKGKYCITKNGKVETIVQEIYNKRRELKKAKDPRQYALKIVINTLYGCTGNAVFKNLFNYNSAYDCTLIGRESVKLARRKFKSAGYNVLYTDTDSVYIQDVYKDKQRLLLVKDSIINEIKKHLPFPAESFDMGIDDEIEHIWFFEKNNKYLKKFYMYVTTKGKVVVKGLPMIKNDSSLIGYKIFKKYMMNDVKNGNIKFNYGQIRQWLHDEIDTNIKQVARNFKVYEADTYKMEGQLQAQIATRYGVGNHLLLPNRYIGAGKSVKYCTIKEFKDKQLNVNALVLNKFWSEMEIFSNYVPTQYKANNKNKGQVELLAWASLE
jgi:DNA polymerase elongation subunit (family B)